MAESDSTRLAEASDYSGTLARRRQSLVWRRMGGETVLFNPDCIEAYLLNRTATAIWELCDGAHSLEDMADAIADRFETGKDRAEILRNIVEFIAEGERDGYIQTGER